MSSVHALKTALGRNQPTFHVSWQRHPYKKADRSATVGFLVLGLSA
jgi:hypothetical protein